jgi:hypothetical protein
MPGLKLAWRSRGHNASVALLGHIAASGRWGTDRIGGIHNACGGICSSDASRYLSAATEAKITKIQKFSKGQARLDVGGKKDQTVDNN